MVYTKDISPLQREEESLVFRVLNNKDCCAKQVIIIKKTSMINIWRYWIDYGIIYIVMLR